MSRGIGIGIATISGYKLMGAWIKDFPMYEHDCSDCEYVRSAYVLDEGEQRRVDAYLCRRGKYPTAAVRLSDEGCDYLTGLDVQRTVFWLAAMDGLLK